LTTSSTVWQVGALRLISKLSRLGTNTAETTASATYHKKVVMHQTHIPPSRVLQDPPPPAKKTFKRQATHIDDLQHCVAGGCLALDLNSHHGKQQHLHVGTSSSSSNRVLSTGGPGCKIYNHRFLQ
jgi:hypothetical protein